MATQARLLPLPAGEESLAWCAILDVLRSDPTLKRIGLTIRAYEGGDRDLFEAQSVEELPLMFVDPEPAGSAWLSASQHAMEWPLRIKFAIPSTLAVDVLNTWTAIRRAIWPTDLAQSAIVRGKLDGVVAARTMTTAGIGVTTFPDGTQALHSEGVIQFKIHANS
jgi:hypothetical protein